MTKKKNVSAKNKKKPIAENPPVKSQSVFETRFTKTELVHLRDLFGIFLPPNGALTISQSLAKSEGRVVAEHLLFEKIMELCEKAKIPTGEEAPDHVIGFVENPTLGVFQMSIDFDEDNLDIPEDGDLGEIEESSLFNAADHEDEDD